MRISDWSSDVCSSDLVLPGFSQLGADQAGLELRCLGSFIAAFDGGAYIKVVLEGDVHWENAKALFGLPDDTVRDEEAHPEHKKIGRASWRERVCQYV